MDNYKLLLEKLVSLESVSTSVEYKNQIDECVNFLEDILVERGFTVDIIPGYGNPLILASFSPQNIENPKTCLIYGHYDVQPADIDGWYNDPFVLTEKDGRYYGRGVLDNKGQFLIHMSSIFDLIDSNSLGYNVKILLEGNEETGSGELERFIEQYSEALAADFVIISDGEISKDTPVIEVGFRGVVNCKLETISSHTDLHSGIFGGGAIDAGKEMVSLLSKMYNNDGSLNITEMNLSIPEDMKKACLDIPFDESEYKNISGTKGYFSTKNFYIATGLEPAITVTGLEFGYLGEGYRNAIAHKALAKINIRTSPLQNAKEVSEIFKNWVGNNISENIQYTLNIDDISESAIVDTENDYIVRANKFLEEVYGKKPIMKYCGGTLPIASMIQNILKVPQLYIPFGNEDCNMHGTNENFVIEYIEKGLRFSKLFLKSIL